MATKSQRPPIFAEIGDRIKNRPARNKNAHLSSEDKLLILWGTSRDWTIRHIAQALPASPTTVKTYRQRIFEDPLLVFELPVLRQASGKKQQCQLCGEERPSRVRAMRHVLAHIFPYEIARDVSLSEAVRPL